jgi:hypothetical protein
MISTRSASTAVNKHKGLQQFFKWLMVDEQAIDASPMQRVRQPKTPTKLVPVLRDEDTSRLLAACKGTGFVNLRDEALIRLYANTGARLSEVGNLLLEASTWPASPCTTAARAPKTAGSDSDPRPPEHSAATCAPAPNTKPPGSPTSGWPSGAQHP